MNVVKWMHNWNDLIPFSLPFSFGNFSSRFWCFVESWRWMLCGDKWVYTLEKTQSLNSAEVCYHVTSSGDSLIAAVSSGMAPLSAIGLRSWDLRQRLRQKLVRGINSRDQTPLVSAWQVCGSNDRFLRHIKNTFSRRWAEKSCHCSANFKWEIHHNPTGTTNRRWI